MGSAPDNDTKRLYALLSVQRLTQGYMTLFSVPNFKHFIAR